MADLKLGRWFACVWCWALASSILAGCGDSFRREVGVSDLEDPNPTVRIMAIKWAGDNKVSSAVPALVDLLEDEDPSVRFYAIEGLERITGKDHGYDYRAGPSQRAAAVKRWRESLKLDERQNDESQ
ncbi:MAG: HEAT repeat domain-containing protein [Planctomycetota bacterium]